MGSGSSRQYFFNTAETTEISCSGLKWKIRSSDARWLGSVPPPSVIEVIVAHLARSRRRAERQRDVEDLSAVTRQCKVCSPVVQPRLSH